MARFSEWTKRHHAAINAVLTCFLVSVGALQVVIIWKQLQIYGSQLQIGMNDERGWMQVLIEREDSQEPIEGVPITAKITLTNIGKTPIFNVRAKMVVRVIENGTANDFSYRPAVAPTTGALFPNEPDSIPFPSMEVTTTGAVQPHPLSHYERTELVEGRAYIVAYAETTYCDIFRVPHMIRKCSFRAVAKGSYSYSAYGCTNYNSVDIGSEPDAKLCPSTLIPMAK
jgi:hypothetical protein